MSFFSFYYIHNIEPCARLFTLMCTLSHRGAETFYCFVSENKCKLSDNFSVLIKKLEVKIFHAYASS